MIKRNYLEGPAGLLLNLNRRVVIVGATEVDVSRREFDLLEVLLRERGRVVTFEELAQRAWGHAVGGDARFIYTTAWRVRRALEAAGAPGVIEGVRGVGYAIGGDAPQPGPGDLLTVLGDRVSLDRALVVFDPSDPDMRLSMVNEAAIRLSGYSAEAFTNLPEAGRRLWHDDHREVVFETVRRAMNTGHAEASGWTFICADDSELTVDPRYSRLEVPGRGPLGFAEVVPTFR